MDPPIEGLLDKVDSKFTLVALAARRARQVNSYYNSLGEGLGVVVPPQVASPSGKPLSIAFEEVAEGKATYTRPDPEEVARAEAEAAAALALVEGGGGEGASADEAGGADGDLTGQEDGAD
jgi:DNA-directed RNA polymerase subunit omega